MGACLYLDGGVAAAVEDLAAFTDWMVAAMAGAGAGAGLVSRGLGRKPRSNQIKADGAEWVCGIREARP